MKTTRFLFALLAVTPLVTLACSSDDPAPTTPVTDAGTDAATAPDSAPPVDAAPDAPVAPVDAGPTATVVLEERFENPVVAQQGAPLTADQGSAIDYNATRAGIVFAETNGVRNQSLSIQCMQGQFCDSEYFSKAFVNAAPLGAKYRVDARYIGQAPNANAKNFLGIAAADGTPASVAMTELTSDSTLKMASFEFTVDADNAGVPLHVIARTFGIGAVLTFDDLKVTRIADGAAPVAAFGVRNPSFEIAGMPVNHYTHSAAHWRIGAAFSYVGILRPNAAALDAIEPLGAPALGNTALDLGFANGQGSLETALGTPPAGKNCIRVTLAAARRKDVDAGGFEFRLNTAANSLPTRTVPAASLTTSFKDITNNWSVPANTPDASNYRPRRLRPRRRARGQCSCRGARLRPMFVTGLRG
jgi:hypothetical protein